MGEQTSGTSIALVAVQTGQALVVFAFVAGEGVDVTTLPLSTDVAKKGVATLLAP